MEVQQGMKNSEKVFEFLIIIFNYNLKLYYLKIKLLILSKSNYFLYC